MQRFDVGDEMRIGIPDETDPGFEHLHGRTGEAICVGG